MKIKWALPGFIFVLFAFAFSLGNKDGEEGRIEGFTIQHSDLQRQLENKLKSLPQPKNCEKYLRFLTEEPHIAGTDEDYRLAQYVRDRFIEFGLEEVELVEYKVLLSYPKEISVEMVEPQRYKASLREDGYWLDKDSYDARVSSGFNAYSESGEVTAPVIYAHSGNPEDYDKLLEMGIDIKGKIALVRYSMPYSYRGFKALTAQKRGAAALLIYSDPMDDGYVRGDVYPYGPWGSESHMQRGGIPFDFIYPGDPLTPGWASVEGAKRIKPEEAQTLPKIISVPLSPRDARPILENLAGPPAPAGWQGGLPFAYHVGPGPAKVHLNVQMEEPITPIWNVVGRISGSQDPDKWVVIGNHRDAWVYGAVDPNSGTSSMLELARSLGLLTKEGHRPKRTIVFCSWDAEEYTLTGSTEWAEQWQGKLRKDGVTYINVDSACRGPRFSATAMPFLRDFMNSITKEVIDPNTGMSIYDARMREAEDRQRTTPAWAEALEEERPEAIISTRVGSGSDHTAFINFICMPVIGLGFGGPYGVYHSQYDNFYWMSHFGDPQFRYHSTMSVIWGMTALRLANADLLPFDYSAYGQAILSYLEEKEKGVSDTLLSDLKSLRENIDNFKINAQRLNQRINQLLSSGEQISPQTADLINTSLMKLERCFGHDGGIPNRSWFKHLVYAPKFTYASEVIPGITEAVEDEDWERAKEQIRLMGNALNKANETLLVPLEQIKSSNPRSK